MAKKSIGDFVFSGVTPEITLLSNKMQSLAEAKDISALWKSCEAAFASKSLNKNVAAMSEKLAKTDGKIDDFLAGYKEGCDAAIIETINDMNALLASVQIYSIDIEVATADVLALNSGYDLVAAPGADKLIVLEESQVFLDFESAGYADLAGKNLQIRYASTGVIWSIAATEVFTGADKYVLVHPETSALGVNQGVELFMSTGDVTTGDSPLKVRLRYRIVDVIT